MAKAKNPVTSDKTYKNMAIQSISIAKSADIGYARQIPITFKEIRVTSSKTTTIPDSYGKSGETGANAGTASTSTSSTPPASNNAPASGGSRGGVLWNLANNAGLLPEKNKAVRRERLV